VIPVHEAGFFRLLADISPCDPEPRTGAVAGFAYLFRKYFRNRLTTFVGGTVGTLPLPGLLPLVFQKAGSDQDTTTRLQPFTSDCSRFKRLAD
jgi:hypothetical protein